MLSSDVWYIQHSAGLYDTPTRVQGPGFFPISRPQPTNITRTAPYSDGLRDEIGLMQRETAVLVVYVIDSPAR
jgi:hypothetical protein